MESGYFPQLSDGLLDVLVDGAAGLSPLSAVLFFQMHGAATRVAPGATAFAARRDQWDIDILTQWTDPADSDAHVAWTRTFWNALVPFSEGVYVNHLDGDEAVARVRSAYGTNYDRLAAIKARYDPDNLFRHNNNIPPA
ncbi:MAG: BBE domain-containing protein [Luteitalea sp.]